MRISDWSSDVCSSDLALENWRESNPNPEAAAPPEAVRERLKTVYGSSYSDEIDGRSDDQVLEMASLLTNGVPMATPVFDGAREEIGRASCRERVCQYV